MLANVYCLSSINLILWDLSVALLLLQVTATWAQGWVALQQTECLRASTLGGGGM